MAVRICPSLKPGEVVEWFMALVLKTSEVKASVSSNLTLSALPEYLRWLEHTDDNGEVSGSSPDSGIHGGLAEWFKAVVC